MNGKHQASVRPGQYEANTGQVFAERPVVNGIHRQAVCLPKGLRVWKREAPFVKYCPFIKSFLNEAMVIQHFPTIFYTFFFTTFYNYCRQVPGRIVKDCLQGTYAHTCVECLPIHLDNFIQWVCWINTALFVVDHFELSAGYRQVTLQTVPKSMANWGLSKWARALWPLANGQIQPSPVVWCKQQ